MKLTMTDEAKQAILSGDKEAVRFATGPGSTAALRYDAITFEPHEGGYRVVFKLGDKALGWIRIGDFRRGDSLHLTGLHGEHPFSLILA